MAADARLVKRVKDDCDIPDALEACVLTTGPEPGIEALFGLIGLPIGLVLGSLPGGVVVSLAMFAGLALRRTVRICVLTPTDVLAVKSRSFRVGKPDGIVEGSRSSRAKTHFEYSENKALQGKVNWNGQSYWVHGLQIRSAKRIAALLAEG